MRRVALLALAALACATPAADDPSVVVARSIYTDIERGPMFELCALESVDEQVDRENFPRAEGLADRAIDAFARAIASQGGRPVSVANQAEYEAVQEAVEPGERLIPLDWCYRELLHRKAFLQAHRGNFDGALATLEREAHVAPTAAAPFVERGYILNRLGRFDEALRAYERALALAERYLASQPQASMALRGAGFSLIELGDLDAAEHAFRRSIELDPENDLAWNELRYIERLRRREH